MKLPNRTLLLSALALIAVSSAATAVITHHLDTPASEAGSKSSNQLILSKTIGEQLPNHAGETVIATGYIVNYKDTYYLVNNVKESGGVQLDFSTSKIDPKRYAQSGAELSSKVTVTGKITTVKPNTPYLLQVISIN